MMRCAKCGAELKKGAVYCSRCGQEVQVVSDLSVLEEDYLRSLVEDKNSADYGDGEDGYSEKDREFLRMREEKKEERRLAQKKKKRRRRLILVIIVIAAVVAVIFGFLRYRQNHSVEYLLSQAQTEYSQKDYKGAESYLDRVLALDEDNIDALLLYAKIYAAEKDYDAAEELYLYLIELDSSNIEAWQGLLELYDAQGLYDRILELMEEVTDEDILELFGDFVVTAPEISVESGSYSEYFTVEITAEEKNLSIYYTLDGSTPTEDDTLYTEPVEINEQGVITLTAVCIDRDGKYSEAVCAVYRISLEAPDQPTVYPSGGTFTVPTTVVVTVPAGTTVYYTWSNTTPTSSSTRYTGPITIPEGNNILSLVAIDEYGMSSSVLKCNYIYYPSSSTSTETDSDTEDDTAAGDSADTGSADETDADAGSSTDTESADSE
ncbi:MAG: chitobiase/beta-hexosaminidase C-terminal domain-containing protein [Clostridiales bacterium]|nr:chitobiase/beta-hexosaminidase C-terminal domain-containing protein [Clostridiales bacterium]